MFQHLKSNFGYSHRSNIECANVDNQKRQKMGVVGNIKYEVVFNRIFSINSKYVLPFIVYIYSNIC